MTKRFFILSSFLAMSVGLFAQAFNGDYWQQKADYKMDIDFDVTKHQFDGKQSISYTNNSPDQLNRVFYHLYFNAFQPNSMMDVRTETLPDGDPRVKGRISQLKADEQGYIRVSALTIDGKRTNYRVEGTILEVDLPQPIAPGQTVVFDMEFKGQVPLQIRRSGRDNAEGISYSMTQWYPKMCEYDYRGWHANPYIGREFYGIWGDFDVTIHIDKDQIIGASGVLQNKEEVGAGYLKEEVTPKIVDGKRTWHFLAENVHDFAWGADPDYEHKFMKGGGEMPELHYLYQPKDVEMKKNWRILMKAMPIAIKYANKHFGKYPYPIYSFIQGGDGGMEYPMATLITGERNVNSLVGVAVHELMHSWYQMILATDESHYAWMDEGFTSYASARIMNHLRAEGILEGEVTDNPFEGTYSNYLGFNQSGMDEPLCTHADHFQSNAAYGVGSYVKGVIFLHQLEYIVGKRAFDKGMLVYFNTWKFKHPTDYDFIRVMEKVSGLELDWYLEYWKNTTYMPDYGIKSIEEEGKTTRIVLEKVGLMPMPVDVVVTYTNGKQELYNIALRMMRGNKPQQTKEMKTESAGDWPWTHASYELLINSKKKKIKSVEIDPSHRLIDQDRSNNLIEVN